MINAESEAILERFTIICNDWSNRNIESVNLNTLSEQHINDLKHMIDFVNVTKAVIKRMEMRSSNKFAPVGRDYLSLLRHLKGEKI